VAALLKLLVTIFLGALFALATAFIVLVYWLIGALCRLMYPLTLPLRWFRTP